jgi:hypothetical protein
MVGGFSESQHGQPTISSDVNDLQRNFYHADVYAIHRQQEITKKNIQKIMKWHNCLHHAANPAVMARAIRSGAWPGVDIEPKCIEQTFLRMDCMSCLLGK